MPATVCLNQASFVEKTVKNRRLRLPSIAPTIVITHDKTISIFNIFDGEFTTKKPPIARKNSHLSTEKKG